jgi:hypothetical protein
MEWELRGRANFAAHAYEKAIRIRGAPRILAVRLASALPLRHPAEDA